MTAPDTPGRYVLRALALAAALGTLLVVLAAPAAAASSCGRAVIDDWYEDGRVDGTYALRCYDDAIASLPRDVRDYSSAKEDIQRALQARRRGEDPPPARMDPSPGTSDPDTPVSSGGDGEGTETTGGGTSGGPPDAGGGGEDSEAAPPVDTESASSIPIPLLILAGLALLLVAGGSAGYLIRRLQARRVPTRAT